MTIGRMVVHAGVGNRTDVQMIGVQWEPLCDGWMVRLIPWPRGRTLFLVWWRLR